MPLAEIVPQTSTRDGLFLSFEATNPLASGGMFIDNSVANVLIYIKNDDASSHSVTIVTPGTVDQEPIEELVIAIPAGEERIIGPFPKAVYNNTAGQVSFSMEADTSVTVAALKMGSLAY
jgi:hypothetical protein